MTALDVVSRAATRDKFARDALTDLPSDAPAEVRARVTAEAEAARRAHAVAVASVVGTMRPDRRAGWR